MPESTLQLTYDDILAQVTYLGHGVRSTTRLSQDEKDNLTSIIRSGLRKFYYPATMGDGFSHEWSFLKPTLSMHTETAVSDYDLPPDWGGMIGSLYYTAETNNAGGEIRKVSEQIILQQRSWPTVATGRPRWYAERCLRSAQMHGQRWEILVWPEPDSAYHLSGKYRVSPNALTDSLTTPYGGVEHSETILEACLAEMEQRTNGAPGPHAAAFLRQLQASIIFDQGNHAPDYLGYNGNMARDRRAGLQSIISNGTTINGVVYSD